MVNAVTCFCNVLCHPFFLLSSVLSILQDICFRYAFILLVVFQLLMSNVSLLGHLCGILSGFACMSPLFLKFIFPSLCFLQIMQWTWLKLEIYLWLSTFSDTYGLFNFLIPGPSFYSAIESSSWLVSTLMELAGDSNWFSFPMLFNLFLHLAF